MENSNNNEKENEYQGLSHSKKTDGVKSEVFDSNTLTVHKLNATWCFWYASRKTKDHSIPYSDRLKKFADFSSVEDFFKYYVYLKSASEIDRNTDLSLFKKDYQPLWESCPNSGCLFIRFKKNDDQIRRL